MMLKKKILHIFPSKNLKYTGVYKYNLYLNKILKKKFKTIILNEFCEAILIKQLFRIFFFPIIVIYFIIKEDINTIILPEENTLSISIIKKILKINIIVAIHDFRNLSDIKSKILSEQIKIKYLNFNYQFINFVNTIIVPSNETKKKLNKIYKRIEIIPNFFEISKIFIKKKKLFKYYEINEKKKIILNIGSNQTNKNLETLKKFIHKNKKLFLIQIGSQKYERTDKILYLKNISQIKLNSFLNYSDLYISTSYFEGFGRPSVEARLYKTPVLCINNKINKEVLANSSYYFKNVKDLNKMINIALKNKKDNKHVYRFLLNKKNILTHQLVLDKIV